MSVSASEDKWAIPVILKVKRPGTELASEQLRLALQRMGLHHLYTKPWDILEESYVRDFVSGAPMRAYFQHKPRGRAAQWDLEYVGKSFKIPRDGKLIVSKNVTFSEEYFRGDRNSKHGWNISQCQDTELRAVLNFIMPIFHPRKPTYAPIMFLNSIVASWKNSTPINWAHFMREVIMKELDILKSGNPTYLPCYLVHLYYYGDCLLPNELDERRQRREQLSCKTDTEDEEWPETDDDEGEDMDAEECPETDDDEHEERTHSPPADFKNRDQEKVAENLESLKRKRSTRSPRWQNGASQGQQIENLTPEPDLGPQSEHANVVGETEFTRPDSEGYDADMDEKVRQQQKFEYLLRCAETVESLSLLLECNPLEVLHTVRGMVIKKWDNELRSSKSDASSQRNDTTMQEMRDDEPASPATTEVEERAKDDMQKTGEHEGRVLNDEQSADRQRELTEDQETRNSHQGVVSNKEGVLEENRLEESQEVNSLDPRESIQSVLEDLNTFQDSTIFHCDQSSPTPFILQSPPVEQQTSVPVQSSTPSIKRSPPVELHTSVPEQNPTTSIQESPPVEQQTSVPVQNPTPSIQESPPVEQQTSVPVQNPTPTIQESPPVEQQTLVPVQSPTPSIQESPRVEQQTWTWLRERRQKFHEMIATSIREHKQFLPVCQPPFGFKVVDFTRIPTYIPPGTDLPISKSRSPNYSKFELWMWVYFCRRLGSPFPNPPEHIWPEYYFAWVAPDGYLISHQASEYVVRLRYQFEMYQSSPYARDIERLDIGLLLKLPKIDVIPPLIYSTCVEQIV